MRHLGSWLYVRHYLSCILQHVLFGTVSSELYTLAGHNGPDKAVFQILLLYDNGCGVTSRNVVYILSIP